MNSRINNNLIFAIALSAFVLFLNIILIVNGNANKFYASMDEFFHNNIGIECCSSKYTQTCGVLATP
jgi:hypothetical protein